MMTTATIRRLPRHRIVTLLKARRVRQRDIADRAQVDQSTVSRVIARRAQDSPLVERVWREIELALTVEAQG